MSFYLIDYNCMTWDVNEINPICAIGIFQQTRHNSPLPMLRHIFYISINCFGKPDTWFHLEVLDIIIERFRSVSDVLKPARACALFLC